MGEFQENRIKLVRSIPETTISLISRFEGYRLTAYLDVVGIPTIGYGSTSNVHLGMSITKEEAISRLTQDLQISALAVTRLVKVPINDNQYAALIDFCFNLGGGALQRSTLRMKLNNGYYDLAANEFMKWCKAGGRILKGLVIRRNIEKQLFLS